jgi:hypothetical protein
MKYSDFKPGKYYKIDGKIMQFDNFEKFGKTNYKLFFTIRFEDKVDIEIGENYPVKAEEISGTNIYNKGSFDKDIFLTPNKIYVEESLNKLLSPKSNSEDLWYDLPIDNISQKKVQQKSLYSPNTTNRIRRNLFNLQRTFAKKSRIPTTSKRTVKKIKSNSPPKPQAQETSQTISNLRDVAVNMNDQHLNMKQDHFRSHLSPSTNPSLPAFLEYQRTRPPKLVEVKQTRSSTLRSNINTTRKLPTK